MKMIIYLVVVMSLIGCIPSTRDYYYASLESIFGIEVLVRGKVPLRDLSGNSEIQISYILTRDMYNLYFQVGDTSHFPHFTISVKNSGGDNFHLKPCRNLQTRSKTGAICASYYSDTEHLSKLFFSWSIGCLSENIAKYISFDVIDENGTLIAQEELPFILIQDGRYTLIDGL